VEDGGDGTESGEGWMKYIITELFAGELHGVHLALSDEARDKKIIELAEMNEDSELEVWCLHEDSVSYLSTAYQRSEIAKLYIEGQYWESLPEE
jgi:hypothetical protein